MTRIQLLGLALVLLASGCASVRYPVNERLEVYDPDYGYRFGNVVRPRAGANMLVVANFSGGGTRAAALAYGVLEELARTEFVYAGRKERLLDHLALVSAVSGGSVTAAYYGLFGERIFEDFERRFLKRDVQDEIQRRISSPPNLLRIASPLFGRTDVVAEYLDEEIFERKTFGDLLEAARRQARPYVLVSATDMSLGSRFEFSQEQFDPLCSDLSTYPVARAVAASSAIPLVLSPLTLRNYAGQCGYREPGWIAPALADRERSVRRFYRAAELRSYLDGKSRPFLHLLDGGLADNVGVRATLDPVITAGGSVQLRAARGLENMEKVVYIVSNAQVRGDFALDQREYVPAITEVLFAAGRTVDRYSVESIALLRSSLAVWAAEIEAERQRLREGRARNGMRFYLIEVSFDALKDDRERAYFNAIPTGYSLPAETVDRLRGVVGRLVRESPDFRRLMHDLDADSQ